MVWSNAQLKLRNLLSCVVSLCRAQVDRVYLLYFFFVPLLLFRFEIEIKQHEIANM